MLAGWELVIGLAALLLGSFVFSAVGFGMALAMAPILLLILEPRQVVVLANTMIVLATVMILAQTWRHYRWSQSWLFVVAGLPPVVLGVFLLNVAAPTVLRTAIAALILVIAVANLCNVRIPQARTRWAAVGFGFTTTLLTTTLSIGGFLAGIYAIEQDWSREQMRATLAVYFLLAGVRWDWRIVRGDGADPPGDGVRHRGGSAGGGRRGAGRRLAVPTDEPGGVPLRGAVRDYRRMPGAAGARGGAIVVVRAVRSGSQNISVSGRLNRAAINMLAFPVRRSISD